MSQYYYIISSLPSLFSEMSSPPDLNETLDSLQLLSENDRNHLLASLDWKKGIVSFSHPLVKNWQDFQRELVYSLAKQRAQYWGMTFKGETIGSVSMTEVWEILQGLWQKDNPLEREKYLIEKQFDYLTQMESLYKYFSLEYIIIYFLKLQLIHRRSSFQFEMGQVKFNQIYESIKKKILNSDWGIL